MELQYRSICCTGSPRVNQAEQVGDGDAEEAGGLNSSFPPARHSSNVELENMKTHLILTLIFFAVIGQLPCHGEDMLQSGEYILVKHGKEIWTTSEDIAVVRLWKDDGRWKMGIKDEFGSTTANVQLIAKGSHEKQAHREFLATASMRAPNRREREGGDDSWKDVSYKLVTFTLHGIIEDNGSVVGVCVRTEGGPKPRVQQANFILKPLKAQQDGADQPATAPELRSERKGKIKPKSKVRSQ